MTVETLGHGQFKRAGRFSIDMHNGFLWSIWNCSLNLLSGQKNRDVCKQRISIGGGDILTVNSERLILGHLKNDG